MQRSNSRSSAFTVIELITVLAVLAIFGTLLVPAFAQNNRSATIAAQCLENHGQLIKAWNLYTPDFEDYVPNNYTIPGTQAAIAKWKTTGVCDTWAPNVMTFAADSSDTSMSVTNTALAKASLLAPYMRGDIVPFRCPADEYVSRAQKTRGWKYRLRSVSMNSNWGRTDPSEPKNGASDSSWAYGSGFRQWYRTASVRKPANMYVFIEEHANSINDGFFISSWGSGSGEYPATSSGNWGDVPAFYHNKSTSFAFADGHTERKKWFSRSIPVNPDGTYTTDRADIRDQEWYVRRVAERR